MAKKKAKGGGRSQVLHVRLSPQLLKRLDRRAKQESRNRSDCVRLLLEQALAS